MNLGTPNGAPAIPKQVSNMQEAAKSILAVTRGNYATIMVQEELDANPNEDELIRNMFRQAATITGTEIPGYNYFGDIPMPTLGDKL